MKEYNSFTKTYVIRLWGNLINHTILSAADKTILPR